MQIERKHLTIGGGASLLALFPIAKWLVPWLWAVATADLRADLREARGQLAQVDARYRTELAHVRADLADVVRVMDNPRSSFERRAVVAHVRREARLVASQAPEEATR
jgi:hypothetical protein